MKKQIISLIVFVLFVAGTAFAQDQKPVQVEQKATSIQILDFPFATDKVRTTVSTAYEPFATEIVRDPKLAARFVQVQFQGLQQIESGTVYEAPAKGPSVKKQIIQNLLVGGLQVAGNAAYNKGAYTAGNMAYNASYHQQQKIYNEEYLRSQPRSYSAITVTVHFRTIVYDRKEVDKDSHWSTPIVTPLDASYKILKPNFPTTDDSWYVSRILDDGSTGPATKVASWQVFVVSDAVAYKLGN